MGVVIMVGQILLALTFLVAIHEWGHMFSAKRFGMRVEKFSIGMPPKIYGKQIGETEYSIGALPIGGFVKISGMVDESMDKEQLKQPAQEWEFRSKPTWQRLIVMLGGIIVNIIAGIIIYIGTTFYYGETYLPVSELKYGIAAGDIAQEIGLKTGDKIVNVNGKVVEDFKELLNYDILLGDNAYYTIERNGEQIKINVPKDILNRLDGGKKMGEFISPFNTFAVDKIMEGSNAEKGGLLSGDVITKVNGADATQFINFQSILQKNKEKTVTLEVLRNNEVKTLKVLVSDKGTLGFQAKNTVEYNTKKREFGFGESIAKGTTSAFGVFSSSFMALKKVFKGEAEVGKTFNSPIAIASAFGSEWVWERFWSLTGMISMALAFMNLLPIPALDGGHVQFLLYEMITGRKPSEKVMEYAQIAGMVLLLTLMVYLFGKDIFNLFN